MSRTPQYRSSGGDRTDDWLDMSSNNRAHKDAQQRTIKRLAEYSTAAYRAEYEQIPVQYRAEYKRPVDQRRVFKKWHGEDSIEAQVYHEEIGSPSVVRAAAAPRQRAPKMDPDRMKDYAPPDPRHRAANANDFSGRTPRRETSRAAADPAAHGNRVANADIEDMLAEFDNEGGLGPIARISVALTCVTAVVLSIVFLI